VSDHAFLADWYFHVPNYVLAALMYTLIGRFALSFFFPAGSTNPIFRAFVWITEPVVRMVRFVTPRVVPHLAILIFGALWMLVARFALLLAFVDRLTAAPSGG
jgi:uncharacterized protein YggT (Ycf19 family)